MPISVRVIDELYFERWLAHIDPPQRAVSSPVVTPEVSSYLRIIMARDTDYPTLADVKRWGLTRPLTRDDLQYFNNWDVEAVKREALKKEGFED